MTAVDVVTPLPVTSSKGTLTGLTGYMTLGLGAKAKPAVVQAGDSEALIAKDTDGHFIGPDAKVSRPSVIEWPAPPEDLAIVSPCIFSILPSGTVPISPAEASPPIGTTQTQPSFTPSAVVQIRSSLSLQICQTLPFPFSNSTTPSSSAVQHPSNAAIRLMTTSSSAKFPLLLMTTPTDRAAAAAEGSSILQFSMKSWSEQIDKLVLAGKYSDALALLDTIDETLLPDKGQREITIRALNAVAQFCDSKFDAAIDTFIELDFNPVKVIALYSDAVAGQLSVLWIPLYGGPAPIDRDDSQDSIKVDDIEKEKLGHERAATDLLDTISSGTGSLGGRIRKTGLGMFMPFAAKDDDTASVIGKRKFVLHDDLHRSVETLVRYLADRRPKLKAALEVVNITPQTQAEKYPPLSTTTVEDLFALPNAPLSALIPEQLLRFAQIVDTALYKSYLIIRPTLLSLLCRIANWCEVEEDLRARQKYAELRDLYHGKGMHSKALGLLRELSEKETDMEDKLEPFITYLQKLGPEHIKQIFESSRWVFSMDKNIAFRIFTSEDVELPRQSVTDYLEKIDPKLAAQYLEYVIADKQEENPAFHDRSAELYFSMTVTAGKRGDEKTRKEAYAKLLSFVDTNDRFGVDRLYGLLSSTDLYEARAILLGRLGRHDQALELYVYRLHDYLKAEQYCKRVYQPGTESSSVFLTLCRIYLRPTVETSTDLLQPALDLISRHNPRLDAVETLQLLPPLVTTRDVKAFLIESLRAPIFDTKVVSQISKARKDQISRKLMVLQSKRVKVTDSRICLQCHK